MVDISCEIDLGAAPGRKSRQGIIVFVQNIPNHVKFGKNENRENSRKLLGMIGFKIFRINFRSADTAIHVDSSRFASLHVFDSLRQQKAKVSTDYHIIIFI